MKLLVLTLVSALAAGCVGLSRTETVRLRPEMPFKGDSRARFVSFEEGILRAVVSMDEVTGTAGPGAPSRGIGSGGPVLVTEGGLSWSGQVTPSVDGDKVA